MLDRKIAQLMHDWIFEDTKGKIPFPSLLQELINYNPMKEVGKLEEDSSEGKEQIVYDL